jgi:hypothetical protein
MVSEMRDVFISGKMLLKLLTIQFRIAARQLYICTFSSLSSHFYQLLFTLSSFQIRIWFINPPKKTNSNFFSSEKETKNWWKTKKVNVFHQFSIYFYLEERFSFFIVRTSHEIFSLNWCATTIELFEFLLAGFQ